MACGREKLAAGRCCRCCGLLERAYEFSNMATLSGLESSKLAMPAGRGESEGIACRDCAVGCSSSEGLARLNLAEAFRNIVPSCGGRSGGGTIKTEGGRAGTGGGATEGGAFADDDDLRRNEKLLPRDLCVVTLSLALRDTLALVLALCDADLLTRLKTAFFGLGTGLDCRAMSSELCRSSCEGIGGGGMGGGGRCDKV